jgi:hypothetical protein
MHTSNALAKAAHEAAISIVHDVVGDLAAATAGTDVVTYQNDYMVLIDGPRGLSSITFVPGVEPGNIDVVVTAANGATVRIRGTAYVR